MTSTGIALVLLVGQLVCPSFSQQDTLEQTSPEGGLCLGDVVMYSCSVQASFSLVWRYTDSSGNALQPYSFIFDDSVHSKGILGPLELELTFAEPVSATTGNIMSTATFANGLTAAEEGAVISCFGNNDSPEVTISFAVPTITNVSYCMSTISWSPPPCDANCTVSVDGQDIGTVPCESRNLKTDDSNLSNKTVMIVATDAIGSSHDVSTELTLEDCSGFVEMSTTEVPVTKRMISASISPSVDSGTQGGVVAGVVLGVLLALVLILVIIAILLIYMYFYKHQKKGSGTIAHSLLSEQVSGDAQKSLSVDFLTKCVLNETHEHPITHCAISPDGKCFATADTNMEIRIWEIKGAAYSLSFDVTCIQPFDVHGLHGKSKVLLSLNWLQHEDKLKLMLTYNNAVIVGEPSTHRFHAVYDQGSLRLWTRSIPSILCTACSPSHSTFALSVTHNINATHLLGKVLLGSIDNLSENGTTFETVCEQEEVVLSMSFSHSGEKLVTGSINGGIRMYTNVSDLSDSTKYLEWKAHNGKVHDVQFGSPDEEKVYSLGEDQVFYLWVTSVKIVPLSKIHLHNFQNPPQLTWKETLLTSTIPVIHPATGRNKLFGLCFGYKCILISSVERNVVYRVDSDFNLTKVDLKLPEGPITCLDCMTESLDHVDEKDNQYTLCILGSTDNSVKLVRLRYGYGDEQPGAVNEHDGGAEAHDVSPGEEEHAGMAAGNRMYNELDNDQGQPTPSSSRCTEL